MGSNPTLAAGRAPPECPTLPRASVAAAIFQDDQNYAACSLYVTAVYGYAQKRLFPFGIRQWKALALVRCSTGVARRSVYCSSVKPSKGPPGLTRGSRSGHPVLFCKYKITANSAVVVPPGTAAVCRLAMTPPQPLWVVASSRECLFMSG